MYSRGGPTQHGKPGRLIRTRDHWLLRESYAGLLAVAAGGSVVPNEAGSAGGGKDLIGKPAQEVTKMEGWR